MFVDDALRQKDLVKRLQNVNYDVFNEERNRWAGRLEETTKRRCFRCDPQKYLKEAENKYCALIGQRQKKNGHESDILPCIRKITRLGWSSFMLKFHFNVLSMDPRADDDGEHAECDDHDTGVTIGYPAYQWRTITSRDEFVHIKNTLQPLHVNVQTKTQVLLVQMNDLEQLSERLRNTIINIEPEYGLEINAIISRSSSTIADLPGYLTSNAKVIRTETEAEKPTWKGAAYYPLQSEQTFVHAIVQG